MTKTTYEDLATEPLAVTVRVVVPGDEGATDTLVPLRPAEIPVGAPGGEKVTVPENPPTLVTVIMDVCDVPWLTVRLGGLAVML